MTEPFADRPLRAVLEDLAAQRAAPGGGCGAAWTLALAASLVEMVAAFTAARPVSEAGGERMAAVRSEAAGLRDEALDLAERDATVYGAVLGALRLPREDPEREGRVADAQAVAAEPPLRIAEAAAQVAALAAEVARAASGHVRGDAQAAALLAEGSCRAAAHLAELDLAHTPGDAPRLGRLADAVRGAGAARDAALHA